MRVRFHLDEHISSQIAAALRRRGIDVTTVPVAGLMGASDTQQLTFATKAGRVLVTQDADFLRLHATGMQHAGVAYCAQASMTPRQLLQRLLLLQAVLTAEEMQNHVEFL